MSVCQMTAKEGNPLPECLERMDSKMEGEAAVIGLIRTVVGKASEAAHELVLAELEVPAGAEAVTAGVVPLLEWSRLRFDIPDDQNAVPVGCREPEPDLPPPEVDNWARGVIPFKTLPAPPSKIHHLNRHQHAQGVLHSTSGDSSKLLEKSTHDTEDEEIDGGLWGLDDANNLRLSLSPVSEISNFTSNPGFGGISEAVARRRWHEEKSFFEGLRLREEEAREREAKDCEDHEKPRKRNELLTKGLKRRDWVWDAEGEIIPLNIITSLDKRPLRVIPEVVQVREATTTAAESQGMAQRSGETTVARTRKEIATQKRKSTKCDDALVTQEGWVECGGGEFDKGSGDDDSGGGGGARRNCDATKGLKKKRSARRQGSAKERKRRLSKKLFEISPTSQPPILDTLDLQAGVCVLEGSEKKLGPRFGEQELLARDGLSIDARRAPFPPTTFPPRQSDSSAKERPEIEDNAYLSPEAQIMSSGDALVDNVKTVDPFVGATRMGHAPATGVLPSEAATEPDHPEENTATPYERRFIRKVSHPIGDGGAQGFQPVPPPPIPRKPDSSHRRGMYMYNKPRIRRPRGHRSRVINPKIARRKLLPFIEKLGCYDRTMPSQECASDGTRCPMKNNCDTDASGDNPPRGSNSGNLRPHPPAVHQRKGSTCTVSPQPQIEGREEKFPPISVHAPSTVEGVLVQKGVKPHRARLAEAREGWIKSHRSLGTLKRILLPAVM